ncbi:carbohydrate ABC transporter substrate-binding protein, CUT1 family [Micromonospora echinaurantiaca]|uniref:Carbohydrate ABC transporter substrate-binding protein, CUT1 family n=1 Tax=Micromonospora echinaurantiaca TaxID=47857 RepID=A0A1C5HPW7_9ACTN|nr:sugar ABC transporter substrate-binding protein [Micromonospora echinaurantiaca]SCG48045.1 carbohydrate ABC transporter substrate-binding protein, CUT1 family [Micromonospora echinaurantiaca]
MRRRSIIGTSLAVVAAMGLSACGGGDDGGSGSNTLRVTLVNHVWTENIKKALPEFEKQTGLKVEVTQLGEDQLSDQYNVKLNAGSTDLDVMMYRPLQEGKLFAKNKYLADLTDKAKSDGAFEFSDFQAGPVQATSYEDKLVGVPIITEQEVLYYRKDLLEKSGFTAPPKTLDELKAQAAKVEADNPGVAGFVARTGKSAAVTQFSSFLYSFGGDFVDASGKATVNTEQAKQAYAYYGGLLRDHGPENISTDMSWSEAMAIFTQGKAAFYTEANSLYKNATDPAKSKVSDTVGFATFPAGPAGSKPYNVPSWALGINDASKNKDNAWKFIQWAAGKDQSLAQQKAGVPGARASVWANPEGTSTYPKDLAEATAVSTTNGVGHDRPLVVKVAEAREIVGQPIVDAITGKDAAASADAANEKFQKFLDDEAK